MVDWTKLNISVGAVGLLAAGLWGSLETVVQILLYLIAIDIVTGICAAWVEKGLDSGVGWRKMTVRKATTIGIVVAAQAIEPLLGGIDAGNWAAGFYCATEGLSIVENAGRMGVPLPPFLKEALIQIRERSSQKQRVEA